MTPARCATDEWQLTVAQFGSMIAGAIYDHFAGRLSAPPHPATPAISNKTMKPKLDRNFDSRPDIRGGLCTRGPTTQSLNLSRFGVFLTDRDARNDAQHAFAQRKKTARDPIGIPRAMINWAAARTSGRCSPRLPSVADRLLLARAVRDRVVTAIFENEVRDHVADVEQA